MTAEKADEIMAEYLLKGGKMLSKSCKMCGFPLFEYKGETICVVCRAEETAAEKTPEEPIPAPAEAVKEVSYGCTAASQDPCASELERTLVSLCERIRTESRSGECLRLMKAVRAGAEALSLLRH
ncbi:hypothetical protein ABH15_12405 [Methanoculleus taiwanensis]|uniref:Sjogrens syndrome scleroderma autoantigen 1 n=1 Tax=Methanoculleus taiwanensis TaxID=1550565 RepID=A0A498GYM0_9EURY|nr:hypothetical protein ABH15_12405 [Methanoculleus taiwanensis]